MAGFVVALVLGAAAVIQVFVTVSGTDPGGAQRGAAVVMVQHGGHVGAESGDTSSSDGS